MEVTFLGTGTSQGVPVIGCQCQVCKSENFKDNRLRTSIHIKTAKFSLVIDTGPDFRIQMLKADIRHLDAILLTHEHKDHTAGLDDIRPYYFKNQTALPIYARESVLEQIKIQYAYMFAEKRYPGVPELKTHIVFKNKPFKIRDLDVIPIEVMHYKLPVFGYRFGDFTYITDASFIEEKEFEKIKNTNILVINGLKKGAHISHFSLEEAIKIIQRLKPQRAYIIHISHLLGLNDEINAELPDNISLAYDGLKLII